MATYVNKKTLEERAQKMRDAPTSSERGFLERLKKHKIKFETQVVLHVYIVDFLIGKNIIELDGNSHDGREEYDQRRDEILTKMGYKITRIQNNNIYKFGIGWLEGYKPFFKNKRRKTKKEKNIESKPKPIVNNPTPILVRFEKSIVKKNKTKKSKSHLGFKNKTLPWKPDPTDYSL